MDGRTEGPMVVLAEIIYDCATDYLIESKSLKLYFNSFNNTKFKNSEEVTPTIERDLAKRLGGEVQMRILSLKEKELTMSQHLKVNVLMTWT
jgi:7-cyano-7-deazaguanine reductase